MDSSGRRRDQDRLLPDQGQGWLALYCILRHDNLRYNPTGCSSPLSPSDGAVTNDNKPTFDWSDVTGAVEYQLQVDNSPDFSSPEIQVTVSTSTYTPTAELSEDNYSWCVQARDAASNLSGWSAVWTFLVTVKARGAEVSISLAISAFMLVAAILAMAYQLCVRPKKATRRRMLKGVSFGSRLKLSGER